MLCILLTSLSLKSFNNPLHRSNLQGNVNFDPLGLSMNDLTLNRFISQRSPEEILYDYREAELKHGRLAMMAAVAYPIQELVNPILSKALNFPNELAYEKLSPSLVNGNLDPSVLIFFLGLASGLELYKMNTSKKSTTPGDYNWRFTEEEYGTDEFLKLQAGEVWNGRIAMIAVLGYIVQEAITKKPVFFF
tara:strand:- start:254 stop:826 length:573 start_codon:yes stop_codon:yes gene_type:complete